MEDVKREPIILPVPHLNNLREVGEVKIINDSLGKKIFSLSPEEWEAGFKEDLSKFTERENNRDKATIYWGMRIAESVDTLRRDKILETPLSQFDKLVLGACLAEQLAGNMATTVNSLWQDMSGETREPEPGMRGKILDSVERMSGIKICLDVTNAYKNLKSLKNKNPAKLRFRRYLLPCETMEIVMNKTIAVGIEFLKESLLFALYDYANDKKQVYTINSELLKSLSVRNTELGIMLKSYLLIRIDEIYRASLKQKTTLKPFIMLETILSECGKSNPDRMTKKRVRDKTIAFLEELREKGKINDFEILNKNDKPCDFKDCVKFKIISDKH